MLVPESKVEESSCSSSSSPRFLRSKADDEKTLHPSDVFDVIARDDGSCSGPWLVMVGADGKKPSDDAECILVSKVIISVQKSSDYAIARCESNAVAAVCSLAIANSSE